MISQLRPSLLANAAFSAASGALMLIAPSTVSGWLGLDIAGWLRLFGLVLVGHALLIVFLLPRLGVRRSAQLNLLAIAPYPFLMIAVVAAGLVERSLGQGLVLADGAIIGAVAVVQALGLRDHAADRHPQTA